MPTILISGANRGIGLCLAASVLGRGVHHLRTRRKLVRELRLLIAQTHSG